MHKGYAIAAGHRLTAEAGAAMLDIGGTATDAAIAAAFTAMVAEPVLAGLYGGGFAMIRPAEGAPVLLDAFVDTPKRKLPAGEIDFRAIQADFGQTTQEFHIGAGAIASSGLAGALAEAQARYGRLSLRDTVAPAVEAARKGVEITPYQARLSEIVAPILKASPETRALFCQDGATLPAGAVYRNPAFADVLETFAHEGPRFVQEGEVAQAVLALAETGGHLSAQDLAGYAHAWRAPLVRNWGGAQLALNPPPSLGGMLIAFALEMLPREARPVDIARALEASTRARVEAALDAAPAAGAARLLAPGLLERYRKDLAGRAAAAKGTTHISVIDAKGAGVALTLSNGEGCGLIAPGTGLMPNNMLGEEDLLPNGFEAWQPATRLSSMMAPLAMAWPDGRLAMLGSGGSNRIRSALTQVVGHVARTGMDLADAIEAPRLHVEAGAPPVVDFEEDGLAEGDRAALLAAFPDARGWAERSMFYGGAHGAMRHAGGRLEAAGDPRRAGYALVR